MQVELPSDALRPVSYEGLYQHTLSCIVRCPPSLQDRPHPEYSFKGWVLDKSALSAGSGVCPDRLCAIFCRF